MSRTWLEQFAREQGLAPEATLELTAWARSVSATGKLAEPPDEPAGETGLGAEREAAPCSDDTSASVALAVVDRYEDLGLIGVGGMGEVRRVRDTRLGRTSAMKLVRPDRGMASRVVERFRAEALITAQLEHPGIVPVYDFGRLPDGRLFFVMKEVHGHTLSEVTRALHAGRVLGGWTFRRTIDAVARVAEAVAYAHDRGVLHRDLKPSNVMLGAFGEVLVLDWGLAAVWDQLATELPRPEGSALLPDGGVAGTPAYMSPEQARGDRSSLGPATDVYALGATLSSLLCGAPPFTGEADWVLLAVQDQPPAVSAGLGDDHLAELARLALSKHPEARGSAADLADALRDWLDGAERRDHAVSLLGEAVGERPRAERMARRAAETLARAELALSEVPTWAPAEDKEASWQRMDEAEALQRAAHRQALDIERRLHGALSWDPRLPAVHEELAAVYRARHQAAERAGEELEALRAGGLLRAHVHALPEAHPARRPHLAYLDGAGALTVVTEPPAHARLLRFKERSRRLQPVPVRDLGPTPLVREPLPMGSYLVELSAPGRHTVHYPVHIGRQHHWDGVPPGHDRAHPVYLPALGELGPEDCYVPAGWAQLGARQTDTFAYDPFPPTRVWLDGFVMRRTPLTVQDTLDWLNAVLADEGEQAALRLCPRYPGGADAGLAYALDDGRFSLKPDGEGDVWDRRWPALLLDWQAASALVAWLAASTGQAWSLPTEVQWEKAARGVDGRAYPWGDHFDHSFTNIKGSRRRPSIVPVDALALDRSPYGVTGLAGNLMDWCSNRYRTGDRPDSYGRIGLQLAPSGPRACRGGVWSFGKRGASCSNRRSVSPATRDFATTVRACRPLGDGIAQE